MKQFIKSEEEELLEKAEDGDAEAQFKLGIKYYFPCDGVKFSFTEARRWFKKAADNNYPDAQCLLGLICSEERRIPHDLSKSENYFLEAAKLGHDEAQYEIGKMYLLGNGVKLDKQEGIKWLEKAAEQDNIEASWELCEIYTKGKGTRRNETNANLWGKRAIRLTPKKYLHILADAYLEGKIVQRDVFKAYEIISFISVIDSESEKLSDLLSAYLSEKQIAEVDILKEEYKRKIAGENYLELRECIMLKYEQFFKDVKQFRSSGDS